MRRVLGWALATGLLFGIAAPRQSAQAADVDQAVQKEMQTIITQQLDALGRDDAATAQSFAAPGIKTKFPDPQGFSDMVHNAYAPLIRPRSTHFDAAGETAVGPLQNVTIVDSKGQVWTAVYTFEQVEGQWRINGCVLIRAQSTTT